MFSSVCLFRREAAISLEMPVMYIHSIAACLEALQKPVCVQIKNVSWEFATTQKVYFCISI